MCLAIPGKIVALDAENEQLAIVDVVGVRRKVDLGLLQDAPPVPGDWVLIHVGFAMSKISEADAIDRHEARRQSFGVIGCGYIGRDSEQTHQANDH